MTVDVYMHLLIFVGKSKRKYYGNEEFDQIIQNVDKSISMDFAEAISEMSLSISPPRKLQELFLNGQPIEKVTIFDVGKFQVPYFI